MGYLNHKNIAVWKFNSRKTQTIRRGVKVQKQYSLRYTLLTRKDALLSQLVLTLPLFLSTCLIKSISQGKILISQSEPVSS